jgi:hypothetical protein
MFHVEPKRAADFFCYDGSLSIGQVGIGIRIFLYHWDLQDYLNQWKEGIERIKTHDTSCLITGFKNTEIIDEQRYSPRLSWIVLYKKNNKVIIQKLRLCEDVYDEYVGIDVIINQNNCYNYIPKYNQYYPIAVDFPWVYQQLHEDELDKQFSIKVISNTVHSFWYGPAVAALITIGSYKHEFNINLSLWSVDDYEQQWKEGIARLKHHNTSCLLTWVGNPINGLMRWLLYKRDGNIIFYFDALRDTDYAEKIGDVPLTTENCYDFIPDEQEHLEKYRVEEWVADLKEFDGLEVVWPEK